MKRFTMMALAGLFVLGLSTTAQAKTSDCEAAGSLLAVAPGVTWMLEAAGMGELARQECSYTCTCKMRRPAGETCEFTPKVMCKGHCKRCKSTALSHARRHCNRKGKVRVCSCTVG